MSRTRPSKAATDSYVVAGRNYRRPCSLRSYKLTMQSQDLLNDAVEESLQWPEMQAEWDQCYGNGVASREFDADSWYNDDVDVLADYEWQLSSACKVPSLVFSPRWGISHVPNSWDDLAPSKLTFRDAEFDRKAKQAGLADAAISWRREWRLVERWGYDFGKHLDNLDSTRLVRQSLGYQWRKVATHLLLHLPAAGTVLHAPDDSPLAGKLVKVACPVAFWDDYGSRVYSVPVCADAFSWRYKRSSALPSGWLLVNDVNFTLAELAKLNVL